MTKSGGGGFRKMDLGRRAIRISENRDRWCGASGRHAGKDCRDMSVRDEGRSIGPTRRGARSRRRSRSPGDPRPGQRRPPPCPRNRPETSCPAKSSGTKAARATYAVEPALRPAARRQPPPSTDPPSRATPRSPAEWRRRYPARSHDVQCWGRRHLMSISAGASVSGPRRSVAIWREAERFGSPNTIYHNLHVITSAGGSGRDCGREIAPQRLEKLDSGLGNGRGARLPQNPAGPRLSRT
jgi:hypothetical protein